MSMMPTTITIARRVIDSRHLGLNILKVVFGNCFDGTLMEVVCSNVGKMMDDMMDDMMERLNGTCVVLVAEPPTQLPVVVTRIVLNASW